MKKYKVLLIIAIIFIIIAVIAFGIYKAKENNKVIDLSSYSEDKVFYKNFSEELEATSSSHKLGEKNILNNIKIKLLDTDYNPIEGAKFEFYDDEGYLIFEQKTNADGVIALSGLEEDTLYYFKQIDTKEGLVTDDTLYRVTVSEDRYSFDQAIINANTALTDEQREEYIKNIPEKNKEEGSNIDATEIRSEQLKNQQSSLMYNDSAYIFLKDPLDGLKLDVKVKSPEHSESGDNYSEVTLRISRSFIKSYTVEELDDNDNQIEITNLSKEPQKEFYNGEQFLIKTKGKDELKTKKYKFDIVFEYNNVTYKVTKIVQLEINNEYTNA